MTANRYNKKKEMKQTCTTTITLTQDLLRIIFLQIHGCVKTIRQRFQCVSIVLTADQTETTRITGQFSG